MVTYSTGMVTRIHKGAAKRLFLREHREAAGMSAETMAGRLEIDRISVYRLERKRWGLVKSETLAAYAAALNIEPEDLWRPPGTRPSLDSIAKNAPDDVRQLAADIVSRLVASGRQN